MIPGSNHVIACRHCGALTQYRTLSRESGFRLSIWTDALVTGPFITPIRALMCCRNCERLSWIYEARMVRIYESWEHPKRVNGEPDWYAAPAMLEVGEEHYYAALREGMAIEPVGEMLLRMLAWRRHNDAVRTRDVVMSVQRIRLRQAAQISDECRANMELLAEVLSRRGHIEQIMCAEVLRELGEFDFALDVLALAQTQCHPALARAVRTLCEHEDVRLGEVVRPPWL